MRELEFFEVMFYGGIAAMTVAAVLALAAFVTFKVRGNRLKHVLDSEYGEQEKKA